jgi:hypothetical protein
VERKGTANVIGYCGLTFHGNGLPDERGRLRAVAGNGSGLECCVASRRVPEKLGFREAGRVQRDAVHGDSLLAIRRFEPRDPTSCEERALIAVTSLRVK